MMTTAEIPVQQHGTILKLLKRLFFHISPKYRWKFVFLLALIVLAAIAEIISIGAIMPFLAALSAPEKIFSHELLQPVINYLDITSPDQLLLPFSITFALTATLAGGMRLLLLWVQTRLSFSTGHELSVNIYRRTLFQPYAVHASRNSSEVINGIYGKAAAVTSGVIFPILNIISVTIMLGTIMTTLFLIQPMTALGVFGGFGLIYGLIIGLTRKQLLSDGNRVATHSSHVIKNLQEGLGGIRDVLLHGSQKLYVEAYQNSDSALRRSQGNAVIIGQSPRFLMEALGIVLMTTVAFMLTQKGDGLLGAIPVLGSIAMGAQRLLPVLQQGYQSWSSIRTSQASLHDTLELLDQPMSEQAGKDIIPLAFEQKIHLKNTSFRYTPENDYVIQNIDLSINKGDCIGFVGETGSGKSTIIDIIIGLLAPTSGNIEIDGTQVDEGNQQAWQQHIAHVPQMIFLMDSSIAENIAFGISKDQIDMDRVRYAAEQAQIAEIIESWPEGYRTIVGEQGVRLSGGQRQRIGIARALYCQADVIVLDEATSALDNETEIAVIEAIENMSENITIIMIAHRYSTLRACNEIIQVGNGTITSAGNYQNFIKLIDDNAKS